MSIDKNPTGPPLGTEPKMTVPSEPKASFTAMPNLHAMMRIPVDLKVIVGSASLSFVGLTSLTIGQIISLDRRVGDKVDIVANGQIIARGDIVVMEADQNRFAVAISEIVGPTSS
jgi:flagellar motor switch protein FliN